MVSIKRAFCDQRAAARKRVIEWHFTFDTWYKWWTETGHLHERGSKKGQYVMARFNDVGPYSPDNVKCILSGDNVNEAQLGKQLSTATKEQMSITRRQRAGINCVINGSTYGSMIEASEQTGLSYGKIRVILSKNPSQIIGESK